MGPWVGGAKDASCCPPGARTLSGPQVLLVQFKGTGKYYAIKALKKQEVLSRDEMERCVVRPVGTWRWRGPRMAGLGWGHRKAAAPGTLKR